MGDYDDHNNDTIIKVNIDNDEGNDDDYDEQLLLKASQHLKQWSPEKVVIVCFVPSEGHLMEVRMTKLFVVVVVVATVQHCSYAS